MLNLTFALFGSLLTYTLIMLVFARKNNREKELKSRLKNIENLNSSLNTNGDSKNKSLTKRLILPFFNKISTLISGLLPNKEDKDGKLVSDLRAAGIWISPKEYTSQSIMFFLGFFIFGGILGLVFSLDFSYIFLLAVFFLLVGYVFRRYSLKLKITRRKEQITNALPGVLDLLSISVTAGLGFDQALMQVSSKNKGPLVEELEIARREINLGKTRKEALGDLAKRCQVEELKTFVSAVIQSDELGISLKNVLIAQSKAIRLAHKQKIEEKAMKTPVKIIFPVIFFIFPVIFIVILGPAIPDLLGALRMM